MINWIECRGQESTKDLFLVFVEGWTDVAECNDVDDVTVRFCGILQNWLETNVPLKRASASPAWRTSQLRA